MTPEWRAAVESLIVDRLGEVPAEMADTADRLWRALHEMTGGYEQDPVSILSKTVFTPNGYDEIVALSGVRFVSLCEHHLLPFVGTASLAYLPGKHLAGLSKLARVVEVCARRFQVQERMTTEIADALERALSPRGVAVIVNGEHSCMASRGVLKPGAVMTTSVMRGLFRQSTEARSEVLRLLR